MPLTTASQAPAKYLALSLVFALHGPLRPRRVLRPSPTINRVTGRKPQRPEATSAWDAGEEGYEEEVDVLNEGADPAFPVEVDYNWAAVADTIEVQLRPKCGYYALDEVLAVTTLVPDFFEPESFRSKMHELIEAIVADYSVFVISAVKEVPTDTGIAQVFDAQIGHRVTETELPDGYSPDPGIE